MTAAVSGIRFIDTAPGFAALLQELGRPARLAIDTEAASYHRYSDRICLLQLSTATVTAADPLVIIFTSGSGGRSGAINDQCG